MNSKAQVIAIAEHFGWHGIREHNFEPHHLIGMLGPLRAFMPVPDYLNDLNAMHEAEKVLTPEQSERYSEFILDVLQIPSPFIGTARCAFLTGHATAAQRAEAFLRAVGKREES